MKKCLKDIEKRLNLKCFIPTCNKHCSRQSVKQQSDICQMTAHCEPEAMHAAWKCSYNTQHYFKIITTCTLSSHKHLVCKFKYCYSKTQRFRRIHKNPLVWWNPYILIKTVFLVQKREKYMMEMREYCYILCVCWDYGIYLVAVLDMARFGPRTGVCVRKV